jgi:2-polyprenyl-3-methyl-5-hydroxy-6-metoxy-1,4-benzoquinol methylase
MPREDATRWNARYRKQRNLFDSRPRSFLVENHKYLPKTGFALDVAMGTGSNAGYLLNHGFRVAGLDISWVAVQQAKQSYPALSAVLVDLTQFNFPEHTFDIIMNFYYLDREIWPAFSHTLKPGGLLFFETLTQPMREIKPDLDTDYLLEPGELLQAFKDWQILVYREGWMTSDHGHSKAIASLLARLPEG